MVYACAGGPVFGEEGVVLFLFGRWEAWLELDN